MLWEEASKRNTIAHYELYLKQYPAGKFAALATLNIDQLKADGTGTETAAATPATVTATPATVTPTPAADPAPSPPLRR